MGFSIDCKLGYLCVEVKSLLLLLLLLPQQRWLPDVLELKLNVI